MSLRFIHLSDTHLGFSDLEIQDENGRNIREEDVYSAFSEIVDYIVETKPDFVIHSGDIFHRSSPSNRALVKALKEIERISSAGIPFYMIAGNHDYPKSIFTEPVHGLYKGHSKIFFAEKYETVDAGDYIIHALPHINSDISFKEEASKIKITDKTKPNILMMHLSMPSYLMNEFGERTFPEECREVIKEFDYVALGHWHSYNYLSRYGNVYYAGSTEMISDRDSKSQKGFVEVILDGSLKAEFIPVKTRFFKTITVQDCYNKKKTQIIEEIKAELENVEIKDSIFYLNLIDLTEGQRYEITQNECSELFAGSLYYFVSKKVKGSDELLEADSATFDLKGMLEEELINNFPTDGQGPEAVQIVMELLSKIEEEEANAD